MADERTVDLRLTVIFQWVAGLCGTLMTVAICWGVGTLVDLNQKVAVLVSRPPAVSQDVYERDMREVSGRIERVESRVMTIEARP